MDDKLLRHANLVISTVGTIRRYTEKQPLPCLGPLLDDLMASVALLMADSPVAAAAQAPAPAGEDVFGQTIVRVLNYLIDECGREGRAEIGQALLPLRNQLADQLTAPPTTAVIQH